MTTRAPVTEHRVNVDEQDTRARVWCSCGWLSDWYWSRRRAGEAGRGHLRTSVPPPPTAA